MEYWVALLYSLLAVTALLGNIWVIVVVLDQVCSHYMPTPVNTRNMKAAVQSSATVYLLVLSIVDLISVLPVPFLVIDIFRNEWPFGIVLCKLMFLCEGANKSLSPLLLTALSIDRYVAVCLPMLVSLRGAKFACFVLLLCFICSLFFIVPVLYHSEINGMLDAKMKLHSKCVVEMSQTFDLLQLLFCYVAPLLVICSVYVAILHRLYRHTRKNLAASASANSRTSISLSRVVKSSVLVVAFYFICWTPYWALRFFAMLQGLWLLLQVVLLRLYVETMPLHFNVPVFLHKRPISLAIDNSVSQKMLRSGTKCVLKLFKGGTEIAFFCANIVAYFDRIAFIQDAFCGSVRFRLLAYISFEDVTRDSMDNFLSFYFSLIKI